MKPVQHKTLYAWRKQIIDEATAWARTETLPNSTREAMIQSYINGVSQGMAKILETLRLHEHIDVAD
jgi:hypothetical protein